MLPNSNEAPLIATRCSLHKRTFLTHRMKQLRREDVSYSHEH